MSRLQSYRLKAADGTVTNHTVPSLYDALVAGRGKIFFDLDFLNKVSPKELYDVVKGLWDVRPCVLLYI